LASGGANAKIQQFPHVWHGNISVDDCAKEMFKPSKDSASLHIRNENIFFDFVFQVFVNDVVSEVGFWPFYHMLPSLGPNRYTQVFH